MMDPSYVEEIPIDEKDPIYDEAEDVTNYILSSASDSVIVDPADRRGYDPGTDKAVYGPLLTQSEFKIQVAECLKEYFDSGDADEVIRTLEELGCKEYHPEIVKKAVSLAMDKGPRERELTSRLLSCLQPTPLTHAQMEAGFTILLDGLDELSKDVPDAKVTYRHSCRLRNVLNDSMTEQH
jgi:MA3 domain